MSCVEYVGQTCIVKFTEYDIKQAYAASMMRFNSNLSINLNNVNSLEEAAYTAHALYVDPDEIHAYINYELFIKKREIEVYPVYPN